MEWGTRHGATGGDHGGIRTDMQMRVLGHDPAVDGARIRARLGVVPQEDTLDNELNVFDNLYIYGRYFGISTRAARACAASTLRTRSPAFLR